MNVISSLSHGNTEFNETKRCLEERIDTYTSAIVDLSCMIGMHLINQTSDIRDSVDELSSQFGELMSKFESHTKFIQAELHTSSTGITTLLQQAVGRSSHRIKLTTF